MPDLPTRCRRCDDPAIAVFYFSRGCLCSRATVQPLCIGHAHKSAPVAGGTMELIKDLTIDAAFQGYWDRRFVAGVR